MGRGIPYITFEAAATEGWLEEKAREGWAFTGMSLGRACFKKTDPANTRFRVVPIPKGEGKTPEALRAVCNAPGWDFAEKLSRNFAICRTDDSFAPELPVDPSIRAQAVQREWRAQVFSFLGGILIVLGMLWFNLQNSPGGLEFRLYDLVHGRLATACCVGLVALAWLMILVSPLVPYLAYTRRERKGLPPLTHTLEREKTRQRRCILMLPLAAALATAWVTLVFPGLLSKDINLWDYDQSLPFPLIAEINEGEWREMEAAQDGSWLFSNSLTREYRLLASTVLSIRQSGPSVPVEGGGPFDWKNKFDYSVYYYEMRTEKLAAALAAEFFAEQDGAEHWTAPEGFSASYTVVDESRTLSYSPPVGGQSIDYTYDVYYQELILHRGKTVLRIHYDGGSDLRGFVPLYAAYATAAG